jgi:hypothetical protein
MIEENDTLSTEPQIIGAEYGYVWVCTHLLQTGRVVRIHPDDQTHLCPNSELNCHCTPTRMSLEQYERLGGI